MSQPAVYRGFGLGEFHTAHFYVSQFLTKTFPDPLLAPSQVLGLRDALSKLSNLIRRLLRAGSDPTSDILQYDNQHQTNVLLRVVGAGLVESLEALGRLVEIQAGAEDGSELKWHNWVAALRMAGLLDEGNGYGEEDWNSEGLVAVRRRLEEAAWRIEYLFKVEYKPNSSTSPRNH
ncbi:hypothetical protein L211DRAFT_95749 [Terfezia boudieri ATCC MYA-4762]|uniref:Uncharacterized protein n=1 Tax=Terfezia boudieri ATCC MYA-4762 TaxID=1051890 RepID=A0A3N4LRY9_9PEZI|nr:hypothetical protein L211DRAFT_95749 [Terfezia boudieri ATCC MYA-4762]